MLFLIAAGLLGGLASTLPSAAGRRLTCKRPRSVWFLSGGGAAFTSVPSGSRTPSVTTSPVRAWAVGGLYATGRAGDADMVAGLD
jgi:hypothetical protein